MEKFYLVFSQPEIDKKTRAFIYLIGHFPQLRKHFDILVSYALMDDTSLNCVRELKQYDIEIMLDSGAFHVLLRKVTPQEFSTKWFNKYIEFVNKHIDLFDKIVIPDIPCDERPHEEIQKLPNLEKIKMTINNAVRFVENVPDKRKVMLVVQGYFPNEYLKCLELYREIGLDSYYWGNRFIMRPKV